MRMAALLACALIGAGAGAAAQTSFADLTPSERAALRAEVRALLLEQPQIIERALTPPAYADEAAADRATLDFEENRLFGVDLPGFGPDGATVRMALLVGDNCPSCDTALAEARALAETHPVRVTIVQAAPDLLEALELDSLPSYVFDGLIVRGHVPPMVLERYIVR